MLGERMHGALRAGAFAAVLLLTSTESFADQGDCAQPQTQGPDAAATDCLFILQVAVGTATCTPECICAPKGSLPVSATDALICLNDVVGGDVVLACPCANYTAEATSFISTVDIPFVDVDQDFIVVDCCKDFGSISRDFIERGVDTFDNALAALTAFLNGVGGRDMNASVNRQIEIGELILLLDHRGIDESAVPDTFELAFLQGRYAPGTQFDDAVTGGGEFLIDPTSFMPGTQTPNVVFPTAVYDEDTLNASGGIFQTAIPFGGNLVEVAINDAEIDAMHSGVTEDGLGYEGATVSGYVFPGDLVVALNDVLSSDVCDCLGISQPIYATDDEGVWQATGCIEDAESPCPEPGERNCIVLAESFDLDDEDAIGFCDLVPAAIYALADLDLDGDTETFEAISAGLRFTGAPGSISGVLDQ